VINFLILSLVLCLIIAVLIGIKNKKNSVIKKQLTGIDLIIKINDLIQLLQKHRGLSAALCSGDEQVIYDLKQLDIRLNLLLSTLNKVPTLLASDRWLSFNDHWSRLSQNQQSISAEDSFKQHTNLITNILYLLEDVAELYALTKEHIDDFLNIGFLWRELLLIIESVGQSRAVGTRVVTIENCSSVDKIKLTFLQQHICTVSEEVLNTLLSSNQQKAFSELIEQSLACTQSLSTTITNDIINVEKIVIDRKFYFELATDTMEKLNKVFDYKIEQLKKTLQKQQN
jgi:hypothetical protein